MLLKYSQGFPGGSVVKKKKKICLPIYETQFQSLIWEDPTSWGTTTIDLCSRARKLQLLSPRATAAEACMP